MSAPRQYDHDEARRLRTEGWSYYAIGKKFGVSKNSIRRAIDSQARQGHNKNANAWYHRHKHELKSPPPPPCPNCGRERCRLDACGNYRKQSVRAHVVPSQPV